MMTEGCFVITATRVVIDDKDDMQLDITFIVNTNTPIDQFVNVPNSHYYAVAEDGVGTYKGLFLLSHLLDNASDSAEEYKDIRNHLVTVYSSPCLVHDQKQLMRVQNSGPKMFCEMLQMDWVTGGLEFIRESDVMTLNVECFGAPIKLQLCLMR